jgi:hypothetical protein
MVLLRHADKTKQARRTRSLVGTVCAIALATAMTVTLPTAAHAWGSGGGSHGGSMHGGSMHSHGGSSGHSHGGHGHSFNSFSLSLGFPFYSGPAYYPYPYPYAYPAYYVPPPVVPLPPQSASCQQGRWRQADGSIVSGTACLGADGNWRLAN